MRDSVTDRMRDEAALNRHYRRILEAAETWVSDQTRDEAALNRYFKRMVEAAGALTYIGDRARGWPDYFVFWDVAYFGKLYVPEFIPRLIPTPIELVELKDELGSLEPMQEVVHERLHRRGHRVWVLRGREQVDQWLKLRGVI